VERAVSAIRPIRSFVLRQGRLTEAQRRARNELLPVWGLPFQPAALDLDQAFGRSATKVLEIGFGMGEGTAEIARAHPQNDYLAVEVHTPGVGSLLRRIDELGLVNVRLIQHDAVEVVTHMLAPACLDAVHVFFPDPWPKKRHHKRRLIQGDTVARIARCLKPGGILHVATDWEDYARHILATLAAEPVLANTAPGYAPRPDYRPLTRFESRGVRLGHEVWDIIFRRI
jgi:tRNA (guanine-N7-)-methyltransferase